LSSAKAGATAPTATPAASIANNLITNERI
jgi:hypothetical protein